MNFHLQLECKILILCSRHLTIICLVDLIGTQCMLSMSVEEEGAGDMKGEGGRVKGWGFAVVVVRMI